MVSQNHRNFVPRRAAKRTDVIRSKIAQILIENHGYLRTGDLPRHGLSKKHLASLVADGTLQRVKRGLYKSDQLDTEAYESFADVCRAVPRGVICLLSALAYHELSTINPGEIHLAVESKARVSLPEYPPVRLYYFYPKQFEAGIITVNHPRGSIRIYSAEKTVCDCLRLRGRIGTDLALEGLRGYLRRKDRDLMGLMTQAKLCRVESLLKKYVEAML